MKIFEDMIGSRLIGLNDDELKIVTPDGAVKAYTFCEYEGDCCGYNKFSTLLFDKENIKNNPIIVNIEEKEGYMYDGHNKIITFFGEYKPIAKIESMSSSDSGWNYGACVTIVCKETDEEEIITCW